MSMGSNMLSDSTAAVVLDVMVSNSGEKFVKVRYIDATVRPDLVGKTSTWIDCTTDVWVGDFATVEFAFEGDRRLGGFFRPYVGCRHAPDEQDKTVPRKPVQFVVPDASVRHLKSLPWD